MPSVTSGVVRSRAHPSRAASRPSGARRGTRPLGRDGCSGRPAARSSRRRRAGRCRRWRARWRRRCCARPVRPGAGAGELRPDERLVPLVGHDRHVHRSPSPASPSSRRTVAWSRVSLAEEREERLRPLGPGERPQPRAAAPAITTTYIGPFYGPGAARHGPGRGSRHRNGDQTARISNRDATSRAQIRTIGRSTALTRSPRLRTIRERSQEGRLGPAEPRSALDHVGDAGLPHARAPGRRRARRGDHAGRHRIPSPRARHRHPRRRDRERHQALRRRRRRRHDEPLGSRAARSTRLLGPSGCGKTTTLRMIAGFEQPTAGEILLAGQPVAGVPPYRRNVNTVFQHYALFPHMNVARERRLRPAPEEGREGRRDAPRRRGARARAPGRLRAAADLGALGRPAAARRARPRPRQPPDGAAPRRAARRPRPASSARRCRSSSSSSSARSGSRSST